VSGRARSTHVTIYTDGGADPNPGPGGWGAILVWGEHLKEMSGAEPHTTNNRMELTAAASALRILGCPCIVDLYTDSRYLRQGITNWVDDWRSRGWRTRDGSPVQNVDLWQEIVSEAERHEISWHWVRGHAGNPFNERADALARQARQSLVHDTPDERAPDGPNTESGHDLDRVTIYARGCALGVPGPAGYGAVLLREGSEPETVSGGWPLATSNHAELWAVIAALQRLRAPSRVIVHTGSKYVLGGARRWLAQWEGNGWRTRSGGAVKNRELWQELARVMGDHDIIWVHLPSAEKSKESDAAMRAARSQAEKMRDENR